MKSVKRNVPLVLILCSMLLGSCKKDIATSSNDQSLSNTKSAVSLGTNGIGGFDFSNQFDKVVPFDYTHSGHANWLIVYRPGSKVMFIVQHGALNTFSTPTNLQFRNGLPGYDLGDYHDIIMPYDYESSGKQDYLLVYRPSKKLCTIFKNTNGVFSTVFTSTNGIGGFNLDQEQDRIFAYDHTHSGKMDYLVVYRSGTGACWILKNNRTGNQATNFTPIYQTGTGFAQFYGIDDPAKQDFGFAFDYSHSGKNDYLVFAHSILNGKMGHNIGVVLDNQGFVTPTSIFQFDIQAGVATGDVGFRANNIAFDFDHTGKSDYIISYYPSYAKFRVAKNFNTNTDFYWDYVNQYGVGGFDLSTGSDKLVAFDYENSGKQDYLIGYRPGSKAFWIIKHNPDGSFAQVY